MEHARFGSLLATRPVEVRHDLDGLDEGFWAVVADFEGELTAVRFADVDRDAPAPAGGAVGAAGRGAGARAWTTRHTSTGSSEIRERIAAGTVYQVNLCRVLSHALPPEARPRRAGGACSARATRRRTPAA